MTVKFIPSGRGKAQCPPDPDYPNGVEVNLATPSDTSRCRFDLPYPAPETGMFEVHCDHCGLTILVTAAGRPDDPTSITVPCKEMLVN